MNKSVRKGLIIAAAAAALFTTGCTYFGHKDDVKGTNAKQQTRGMKGMSSCKGKGMSTCKGRGANTCSGKSD